MHSFFRRVNIPEQREYDGVVFPLTLEPIDPSLATPDALARFIALHTKEVDSLVVTHGAVLFRSFKIEWAKDFDAVFKAFGREDLPYIGGAALRTLVHGSVFTANESPPDSIIPFHHEMGQIHHYPQRVMFFCERPATTGGATPLVRSDVVYERAHREFPEFVDTIETNMVRSRRIISVEDDKKSAQGRGLWSTFQATTKEEAARNAAFAGVTLEYLSDGNVITTSKVPGAKTYNGKKVFFNSVVAAYTGWKDARNDPVTAVTFGDGTPLPPAAVHRIRDIMAEEAVVYRWGRGDVFVIDNNCVLHARQSFTGPRRVLAALAAFEKKPISKI